ncbi:MAG: hypothetical protein J7L38_04410 [Thermoproteales archaeon]|nr:hypothetical protein [Thermoproteales archaeon]
MIYKHRYVLASIFLLIIGIISITPVNLKPEEKTIYTLPFKFMLKDTNFDDVFVTIRYGDFILSSRISSGTPIFFNFTLDKYKKEIPIILSFNVPLYIEFAPKYARAWVRINNRWERVYYNPRISYCLNFSENTASYLTYITLVPSDTVSYSNGTRYTRLVEVDVELTPGEKVNSSFIELNLGDEYQLYFTEVNWIKSFNEKFIVKPVTEPIRFNLVVELLYKYGSQTYLLEKNTIPIYLKDYGEEIDFGEIVLENLYLNVKNRLEETLNIVSTGGLQADIYVVKTKAFNNLFTAAFKSLKKRDLEGVNAYVKLALDNYKYLQSDVKRIILANFFYSPIVFMVLALFSLFLSRIFFEKRLLFSTLVVFSVLIVVFTYTCPEIKFFLIYTPKLFVDNGGIYLSSSQRQLIIIGGTMFMLMSLVISIFFGYMLIKSDKIRYSLLLLKRRKLRFTLIIITVSVVASGVMIHGAGMYGPVPAEKTLKKNTSGLNFISLTKARIWKEYIKMPDGSIDLNDESSLEYMTLGEAKALLELSSQNNILAFKTVELRLPEGNIIHVTALATNLTFVNQYIEKRGFEVASGVYVNTALMFQFNLKPGDQIVVDGIKTSIAGILNSSTINRLLDIDGQPILYDPVAGKNVNAFLILPIDFIDPTWKIYKIVLIFEKLDPKTFNDILLSYTNLYSYTPPGSDTVKLVEGYTFLARLGLEEKILEKTFIDLAEVVTGDWMSQSIITLIAIFIISVNALASAYERKKDLMTLSCIGAKPADLAMEILVEGIGVGMMGGLIGYVLGRIMISMYYYIEGYSTIYPTIELFYFLITMFISLISSSIGYLIPARNAILEVVPSQLLRRGEGKIETKGKNEITLKPFLRLKREEIDIFIHYLENNLPNNLAGGGTQWGFLPSKIELIKEPPEKDRVLVIVEGGFKSPLTSKVAFLNIVIEIPLKSMEITPIVRIKSKSLRLLTSSDLQRLIISIREALLSYTDYKKNLRKRKN